MRPIILSASINDFVFNRGQNVVIQALIIIEFIQQDHDLIHLKFVN